MKRGARKGGVFREFAMAHNDDQESPGLPGFRSWRSVYAWVLGILVVWIGLLMGLSSFYS